MKIKKNIAYLLSLFMAVTVVHVYGNDENSASYDFDIQNNTPDKILSIVIYDKSSNVRSNVRSSVRSNVKSSGTTTLRLKPGERYLNNDVSIALLALYRVYVWDQQMKNAWVLGEGSFERQSSSILLPKEGTSEQFQNNRVTQNISYDSSNNQGKVELTLE